MHNLVIVILQILLYINVLHTHILNTHTYICVCVIIEADVRILSHNVVLMIDYFEKI